MKNVNKNLGGGIRRVDSIEEWIMILKEFKSSMGKCDTNCYMNIPMLEGYVEEHRIFYSVIQSTLWCYIQEREYYLGYYYVPKNQKICVDGIDKDLVVSLIGTESKYALVRENELVEEGGRLFKRNVEYISTESILPVLSKMKQKCNGFILKMKIHYDFFHGVDYEEMYKMFKERIDKYSVKLLTGKCIRQMEREKEGIIARAENGKIVAACCFTINGNIAILENIASDFAYNGIGIGSSLFCQELSEIFSRGVKKAFFWVWENNIESRKMSERFATLTGRFSQYIVFEHNL